MTHKIKASKVVFFLLAFLFLYFIGQRISHAVSTVGVINIDKELTTHFWKISTRPKDITNGLILSFSIFIVLAFKMSSKKNYRDKEEYGSAQWGQHKSIEPYMDKKNFSNNILLTQTERLALTGGIAPNNNIMIVGGSGSGKSYRYIIPQLLQAHSSYVVTDPKGILLQQTGSYLKRKGYKIRVLNLKDTESVRTLSMHYNPFEYIRSELDIMTLVECFTSNLSSERPADAGDFWSKAKKLLYMALIAYIYYESPKEEQSFATLCKLVKSCETREDDEDYKSPTDILFEELRESGSTIIRDGKEIHIPGDKHFAVAQYDMYKLAAGKTAKSILISCAADLAPFQVEEVSNLVSSQDEMYLSKIGEEKTAVFVVVSDTTTTLNFIAAIFYTQLFNELIYTADTKHSGKLPVPTRLLLDEFANIGKIPQFEILISTIRSREISASIVLQTTSQLKAMYKEHSETIQGNCAAYLFLGGKEQTTLSDISKLLGKQTIDTRTSGQSRGQAASYSQNYQRTGRELMTIDELAVMDNRKCILMLQGQRPYFSDKIDTQKLPNYKYLANRPEQYFNVKKLINANRPKPADLEAVVDMSVVEMLEGEEEL